MPLSIHIENAIRRVYPPTDWTVTWPSLPSGHYTILIKRADDAADAIAQARAEHSPTAPGYRIDYEAEPAVWRLKPFRARHISGPAFRD